MDMQNKNSMPGADEGTSDEHAGVSGGRVARLQRWGTWVTVGSLLALLAWAALAPLDEGIPTQAAVTIDTKRKMVQHLQGGIVREVLVREGDRVKAGQPLLRLDDAVARANLEATRQRYLSLRAMESRLLAEQLEREVIDFHPDVAAESKDPLIRRLMDTQQQLLRTRRVALQADLQAMEESIRGQEVMRQSYIGMIESRKAQQAVLHEQERNLSGLVKEGYAPRNQLLDLQRQVAEIAASLTDLTGNQLRAGQAIAELRQRALSRRQDYRKETDGLLAEVTRDVQAEEGKVRALRDDLARTEIRSPADGQIVGLQFQTVGGVIPSGQRILDVVPEREHLLLESRIPPHLIDSVKPDLLADVRFSSFAHAPQLVAEGRVMSVSGDLLTEQTAMGPMSFFLARIELTPKGMQTLGRHQIQAGMPAEVIIRTGERTVLTYMLHPLTRRVASSMTEK